MVLDQELEGEEEVSDLSSEGDAINEDDEEAGAACSNSVALRLRQFEWEAVGSLEMPQARPLLLAV